MPVSRDRLLTACAVLALVAFTVGVGVYRNVINRERLPPPPVWKGSAVHRQRIDQHLAEVAGESFEQLVEHFDDRFVLDCSGAVSDVDEAQNLFELTLAHRRPLRVIALLADAPAEQAARRCADVFEKKLAEHRAIYDRVIRFHEVPGSPRNTESGLTKRLALCNALFVAAHFSGVQTVVQDLAAVEKCAREIRERLEASTKIPGEVKDVMQMFLEPDNAFKLNVLVYACQRDAAVDAARRQELESTLSGLERREIELTAWDAETGTFDYTRVHENVPIDDSKGTTKVVLYQWGDKRTDPSFQKATLDRVVRRVQSWAAKPPESTNPSTR